MWGAWRPLFCRGAARDVHQSPMTSNRNYFFSYTSIISNHSLCLHPLLGKKITLFVCSILVTRGVLFLFYWSWPVLKSTGRRSRPSNSHFISVYYLKEGGTQFDFYLFSFLGSVLAVAKVTHRPQAEVWKTHILILEFLKTGFQVITSLKLLVKCLMKYNI